MNRRNFLASMGLAGMAACADAQTSPLKSAAESKGLLAGTAVSYAQLQRPAFTGLIAREADIVVSENDMKWGPLRPTADQFNFTKADALIDFATAHNLKVRGHNLCWHEMLPPWFSTTATKDNAAGLLRTHIKTVAGRYAGKIHSWDVVNEAIKVDDERPDGLRNSIWLQLLGPDYLTIAFQAARHTDPKAILTYNDYDLEQDTPEHEAKRKAVLQLLTSLRKANVPVQALGVQAHLVARDTAPDWTKFHQFLRAVEVLDLQIFVTELDVDDRALPSDIDERDKGVADLYRGFLTNVLQHRAVKAVLTWGISDKGTWLNGRKPRKDGLPQRPLPFDANLQPKPAYDAFRQALAEATAR